MKFLALKSYQVKIDTSSIRVGGKSSYPAIRSHATTTRYEIPFLNPLIWWSVIAILLIILGIILFRHFKPKKTKSDF